MFMFTREQIAALKYLIFNSKDGNDLVKQVMALLIDKSEGLTKSVCFSLVENREGYSAKEISDVAYSFGSMQSANCTTHIDQVLRAMDSELVFSVHYGDFDPNRKDKFSNDGQFEGLDESLVATPGSVLKGMPMRYTFWLAKSAFFLDAEHIEMSKEALEEINLNKPGLYPRLEPA